MGKIKFKKCPKDLISLLFMKCMLLSLYVRLYVVRQLRGKSPIDFVSGSYVLADVNTRGKAKGLSAIAYSPTILQRRSSKNKVSGTYSWLRNAQ